MSEFDKKEEIEKEEEQENEHEDEDEGEKEQEKEEVVPQKESDVGDVHCAICFTNEYELLNMPCCHRESSSVHYCRRCLQVMCGMSQDGVGTCPGCRARIGLRNVEGRLAVVRQSNSGTCMMCCQKHELVERGLCVACLYGQQHAFRYVCHMCNRTQRIPHPMYRYQQTPDELSTASWACHVGCGTYTHWKIHPDDLPGVPVEDMPETWGRGEEVLDAVRQIRQQESREGKGSDGC